MSKDPPRPNLKLAPVLIGAILLVGGVPLAAAAYDSWYTGKIMPGVIFAGRNVGGFSPEYVNDMLNGYEDRLHAEGAAFLFKGKKVAVYPEPIALNSDIPAQASNELYDIDAKKTVTTLTSIGRTGSFIQQQRDRLFTAVFKKRVVPAVTLHDDRVSGQLKKEFSFFQTPAKDADFAVENNALTIAPEARGIEFDYPSALASLKSQLATLLVPTVALTESPTFPRITASDLEGLRLSADAISAEPLTLRFDDETQTPPEKKEWMINKKTIVSWLAPLRAADGTLSLTIDQDAVTAYLTEHIAPDVRVDVRHPRFEIQNGRVVAFDLPRNGKELNAEETAKRIISALEQHTREAALAVKEVQSPYRDNPGNAMIRELVARADTDFSGSPTNRRKNISRGASLINGILIAPGEEFSTIKALGKIDDTNGFLPELVIKGSKTTPEFGGGLCQVSTTLFRAVSFAGLEVLERKNHSYRVSYYEPPVGFDATIYDPAPDFKFKNDTPSYLLVQAHTEKNKMVVELWGTKDGRKAEIDTPTVFNIKKPGETKIVETDELPPGEKKCTERAHNGADAVFERRITYADGTTKKETYKSHYVVWPAVCLVGKEKESAPEETTVPTDDNTETEPPETPKP